MHRRLASWFALVLVTAACAGDPEPPAPEVGAPARAPTPEATLPAETSQPSVEQTAPPVPSQLDFTLPALDGGEVVGVQLAGQHLALWFWTPW